MTVVVMDSDDVSRRLLRRILGQQRIIDVHEASNGAQGLALIERHSPDLVILEEALPLVSGLECLQALRRSEKTRKASVIVTSLRNTEPVVRDFIACGIEDFIVKPLRPRLMQERIARTLTLLMADGHGVMPASNAPTLELGSPVLLIDGSQEYRDFFSAQAGYFFKVLTAPSGAEGLAVAVDALPRGIFFGEETGLLDQERFVAKIRGLHELREVVMYKVASPDEQNAPSEQMDGVVVRTFATDVLRFELARLLKPHLMVEALLAPTTPTTQAFLRAAVQALEFAGLSVQARVVDAVDVMAGQDEPIAATVELHGSSVGVDVTARTTHVDGRGFAAALLGRPEGVVGRSEVEQAVTHVLQAAAGRLTSAFLERGLALGMRECRTSDSMAGTASRLLGVQISAGDARMSLDVRLLGPAAPTLAAPAEPHTPTPSARVRRNVQIPPRGQRQPVVGVNALAE